MSGPTLFPDLTPTEPVHVEKISAGRRRTIRQRATIDAGRHPLTGQRLADNGETCGTCAHRQPSEGPHTWPKCELHLSHGAATDCRAWWPACPAWEAKP